jgi:hypothetical protein
MTTINTTRRSLGRIAGFDITAHIEADEASSITDYAYLAPGIDSPYDQATIDAYHAGDWGYVGIVITAKRAGVELAEVSLWGCECGTMPSGYISPLDGDGDEFANGYGPELIAEVIASAQTVLRTLTDEAIDGSMGDQ